MSELKIKAKGIDPQTQIGQIIDSRYILLSIKGEGSFSVVFLGKDIFTQELYAIKCLYKYNLTEVQKQVQYEEVKMLEQLSDHPNIVKLNHVISTDDNLYLILDYCVGDLFDYIIREKPGKAQVRQHFAELISAVWACHEKGIYHRDLKPENILLSDHPQVVKLCDFGLATRDNLSSEFGYVNF
jgi:serine/threonine protein kinase